MKARTIADDFTEVYKLDIEAYDSSDAGMIANISFTSLFDILPMAKATDIGDTKNW